MATSTEPAPSAHTIRRHVVWNASIVALGGLLFGYDTGVISGALLFIGKDFAGMSSTEKELLTSIMLIGALFAGRVADRIGRRPTVDAEITQVRDLSSTIGIALAIFQQITGINTIIYYARRRYPTPASATPPRCWPTSSTARSTRP